MIADPQPTTADSWVKSLLFIAGTGVGLLYNALRFAIKGTFDLGRDYQGLKAYGQDVEQLKIGHKEIMLRLERIDENLKTLHKSFNKIRYREGEN